MPYLEWKYTLKKPKSSTESKTVFKIHFKIGIKPQTRHSINLFRISSKSKRTDDQDNASIQVQFVDENNENPEDNIIIHLIH